MITREDYKKQFLNGATKVEEPKRISITISRQTRNILRQLCTAPERRIPTGILIENIVQEHCSMHEKTIQELYQNDIPIY